MIPECLCSVKAVCKLSDFPSHLLYTLCCPDNIQSFRKPYDQRDAFELHNVSFAFPSCNIRFDPLYGIYFS